MQEKNPPELCSVRYVKGVGPMRAQLFEKLGITNVRDLFFYLPRRYEDRSEVSGIKGIKPGETRGIFGEVLRTNIFTARTGTVIFEVVLGEGEDKILAVWYNQPYLKKLFFPGQKIAIFGKVENHGRLQVTHPAYEIIEGGDLKKSLDVGRIVPIYSLTEKLSQRYMRRVVDQAIHSYAAAMREKLPTRIRAKRKLVDIKFAVENIHFPYSPDNLEKAYRRLVFEEFFVLQVIMALKRMKIKHDGIKHEVSSGLMADFEKLFPFKLTSDQKKCIKEIELDMTSEKAMNRLLQGDVGSGKTVVAMYALLLSAANGRQGVMMAPTEILARQHYVNISRTFMPLGLNVRLLVSGISDADRLAVKKELADGEADIIIGTHALIHEGVDFRDLGIVIVDEQHKFGVRQRDALRNKGRRPDTLVMTATPIPRTLVLTVFGDMDISALKEKPKGREKVATYWVDETKRSAIYEFIRGEIKEGRQAFIVYPRIEATGSMDLKSAEEMYRHMKSDIFGDLRLALVHGKMKTAEKDRIMEGFRGGKYDILIATTVIEVGVDIPNVNVMFVENAERYGLAQLHQLRGRIGRGKHQSYCILMSEAGSEASQERMYTLAETEDGFEIAEKDLSIRGPGELLGTRQSGLPELRFGDISRDFAIMEEAREDAFNVIKDDPGLNDEHNSGIRESIAEMFKGKLEL